MRKLIIATLFFCVLFSVESLHSQNVIKGVIIDAVTNDPIIGGNVIVEGTTQGTITDWDGSFEFETAASYPVNIMCSYIGYDEVLIVVSDGKKLKIQMEEASTVMEEIVVTGTRISEETKKSPLTIESVDVLSIKETPASNFYEGLGNLKGVDMTTASLGFQIINTRGFNSTSPVRSLQIIDGVDNQAPGLNFSLGNFLGSSELDVLKVDIIVGASSAFYGPNAFNGVISMETKNPFFQKGLSAFVKVGERSMKNAEIRYADALSNKDGHDWLAYKLNLSILDADDWEAENFEPVFDTDTDASNPGRFDAVNIYGDEYNSLFDQTGASPWNQNTKAIESYHRTGYKERDLLEYETQNLKTNAAIHFRLQPEKTYDSAELILSSSFSNGTTIYQGENRFALKDISFFQNRIELRKKDKYFLRAYRTIDRAGDTYDPYFTALELQRVSKGNDDWNSAYINHWTESIIPRMDENGYPQLEIGTDGMGGVAISFDSIAQQNWLVEFQDSLFAWHAESEAIANVTNPATENFTQNFLVPGTDEFNDAFQKIISTPSGQIVDGLGVSGTRIIDRSALYHMHGEYTFEPEALNYLKVGANARLYTPESEGTIFIDSTGVDITNFEFGIYGGGEIKLAEDFTLSGTLRMDKNQNFDYLFSPAASIVMTPGENNFLRVSFSSAIRNPTLSDQYLDFDVGPATLRGNLNGVDSLVTLESFQEFRNTLFDAETVPLEFFSIDAIRPEKVKTIEVGYRTTLFEKLYVDAGYYYSIYNDFIGFNIGLDVSLDNGFPTGLKAFRYSANSLNRVTSQGLSIGLNYFVGSYYKANVNYSWNKLNTSIDDPIIPAFNTPEHKYNLGFSGRNLPLLGNNFGFNFNFKWVQGFLFEGSPQFTGVIDDYGLLDGQINYNFKEYNTTLKLGASNLLNNEVYQTYGGPLVGRLAYVSLLYNFQKK